MAKLLNTPVMKGLLSRLNNKALTKKECQELIWLLSLNAERFEGQVNLTIKTEAGFVAAVELFHSEEKVDLITYNSKKIKKVSGWSQRKFQYLRTEEKKYKICIIHQWGGDLVQEVDHDWYSVESWREEVLKTQGK